MPPQQGDGLLDFFDDAFDFGAQGDTPSRTDMARRGRIVKSMAALRRTRGNGSQ
jgi:hypothetical protein